MVFYAIMLSSGNFSVEVMPQFLVSAVIFLSAGRIMRVAARSLGRDEAEETKCPKDSKGPELDWPWLTALLNWTAATVIIGIMAILLMKPAGVSVLDAFSHTFSHEHFSAEFVP